MNERMKRIIEKKRFEEFKCTGQKRVEEEIEKRLE